MSASTQRRKDAEKFFPRLMWADCDPEDKSTPVVVYQTRGDQRGNRPDLKPLRVRVMLARGGAR